MKLFMLCKSISQLRSEGVRVELYPDASKLDKQFKYAEKRDSFCCFCWRRRNKKREFKLKNLATGEQRTVTLAELFAVLSAN